MKTAGKATGIYPGKYVITRDCEYAAAPFCGVDMPLRPLTWSVTPRHGMLENAMNLLVTAED